MKASADSARAFPRRRGVSDAGEQPAKLHGGRQFASTIEGGADRRGLGLIDDEHAAGMGTRAAE